MERSSDCLPISWKHSLLPRGPNRQLTKRAPSPETVRHAPEKAGRGLWAQPTDTPGTSERTAFRQHLAISREFSEVGR